MGFHSESEPCTAAFQIRKLTSIRLYLNTKTDKRGGQIRSPFSIYGGDPVLIVLGCFAFFSVALVLGCCALTVHDSDLLHQHPPDPDHKQWPQDGDDP